jgi:serine/threonine protein phosphatase 1
MVHAVLERLWGKRRRLTVANAALPEGVRVYAIGDLHGRVDLLLRLHEMIRDDALAVPATVRKILVYLGDYVDRGLQSRELIDTLLDRPLAGFERVYLRGNHDQHFLDFLDNPENGGSWLKYGGDATIYSYGVRIPDDLSPAKRMEYIRDQLLMVVPERHLTFLSQTDLACEIGDFLFVHAGIQPHRPLEEQRAEDLLWIRDEFLESDSDFGRIVVHGHTVSNAPEVRINRIGIDTGACYSNNLTCLVLEGSAKRFISTATS